MELIPGLNNDMANECLLRVPFDSFSLVASTCKSWQAQIQELEFFRSRKTTGLSQPVFVMTQARVNPSKNSGAGKYPSIPVYRLALYEADAAIWCELPPVPDFSDGLPLFCQLVGIRSGLVLLGGWHPKTFGVSNAVYVYDFITATWRRGADMPGVRRSFFGCASDSDRTVYVAGGHDEEKNALRSVLMYDVADNAWVPMPDMAKERDECKAVLHRGKLHVISGYCTERQGQFENTAEAFSHATRQWDIVNEDFLGSTATSPSACVVSAEGKLYICQGSNVAALEGATWSVVAELPADVRNTTKVMTWKGKMLVIGSASFGGPRSSYVLDLKNYTWTQTAVPEEYSGHVQSCCYVEL